MDTLCAAPPEQWSELLEKMGATVRPATEGSSGEPCTVSAWLDALQDPKAQEPSADPRELPTSGAEALLGTTPGDKKRRERKPAEKTVTTAWEEDTRDLNDLLREMGEPVSKAGQRRKAKAAATKQGATEGGSSAVANPQPTLLVSSNPSAALGAKAAQPSKAPVLSSTKPQKAKASTEENSQATVEQAHPALASPNSSFGSTTAGDSAACNESDSKDDVNWVEVPTRAARREAKKRAEKQQLEIQTQELERVPAKRRPPPQTGNQQLTDPKPDELVDTEVVEETMAQAPEHPHTAAIEATSHALQERGRGAQAKSYVEVLQETGECAKRCLSVGDEPRRMASEHAKEHSPPQFYGRPSVGTWLRQAGAFSPRAAPQPAGREEIVLQDEAHELEESSVALEEQCAGAAGSNNWQVHPSVGTWLGTRQEYNWPSTPDTTPRHSCSSGMEEPVVWVAVPLRLLPIVQQVLQTQTPP